MPTIEEIENRLEHCHPWPWVEDTSLNGFLHIDDLFGREVCGIGDMEEITGADYYDASLIKHAPSDLRYLLDKIKELTNLIDTLADPKEYWKWQKGE